MTTYTTQLRQVPGFEHCRRTELAALARSAERLDVPPGGTILGAGDRWTGTCVIEEGQAVAQAQGWTLTLSPGARVIRDDVTASALTISARTRVRVLLLARNCSAPGARDSVRA
jgi:hypothetical protein